MRDGNVCFLINAQSHSTTIASLKVLIIVIFKNFTSVSTWIIFNVTT